VAIYKKIVRNVDSSLHLTLLPADTTNCMNKPGCFCTLGTL